MGECNFMFKRNKGKVLTTADAEKEDKKIDQENPYYIQSLDHYIIYVRLM